MPRTSSTPGHFLRLDCSNDPLTSSLDITGNIGITGTADIDGHTGMGAGSAPHASYINRLWEEFTQTTGSRISTYNIIDLKPSGALSAITSIIGSFNQAHWTSLTVDGSARAYIYGSQSEAISLSGQPVLSMIGVFGQGRHLGTGTATTVIGVKGRIVNDDSASGTITSGYSLLASAHADVGSGTITDRYGLYIEDVEGGGTVTDQYGIYCPALTGAGGDNLFIKNISADSDFGSGDIDTTGETTTGTLVVNGISTFGGNVTIGVGAADVDYTLTFDGETNDGVLTWMEDEDYFRFSDDVFIDTTERIYFRDANIFMYSQADGRLEIASDVATTFRGAGEVLINTNSTDADSNLVIRASANYDGMSIKAPDGPRIFFDEGADGSETSRAFIGLQLLNNSFVMRNWGGSGTQLLYSIQSGGGRTVAPTSEAMQLFHDGRMALNAAWAATIPDSQLYMTVAAAGVKGISVKSAAGQTANLLELQDSSGSALFNVDNEGNLTIGNGAAATDYALTFDGETNDGTLTWMEDEDYFKFDDDILINSTERLYFRDTGIYLYSNADGWINIVADTGIEMNAPTWALGDLSVAGASMLGAGSNYVNISNAGNQTFVGTAGFYPRRISQSAQPASGTGATQIDTGEMLIWHDSDDGKIYYVYNDTTSGVKKVELI